MKKSFIFGLLIGFLLLDRLIAFYLKPTDRVWSIRGRDISLEQALTPEAQSKGLGGRDRLDESRGMIFLLDRHRSLAVWMDRMRFPIDVIFLSDNRVVEIRDSLPVCPGECQDFYNSPPGVNGFIEIKAGLAKELGLKIGDELSIR